MFKITKNEMGGELGKYLVNDMCM